MCQKKTTKNSVAKSIRLWLNCANVNKHRPPNDDRIFSAIVTITEAVDERGGQAQLY